MKHGLDKLDYFVCVGAQKSGTTTLHDLLLLHEGLCLPNNGIKETKYFADVSEYLKGIEYYGKLFSDINGAKCFGEVDPEYLYIDDVADRIYKFRQDAKIIIILRDPVSRAYSHYLMSVRRGFENLSFKDAIAEEQSRISKSYWNNVHYSYVNRGYYFGQIEKYVDKFSIDQVLVLTLDELKGHLHTTINEVCGFLGVSPFESLPEVAASNVAVQPRLQWLSKFLHSDSVIKRSIKKYACSEGHIGSMARWLKQVNFHNYEPPKLEDELSRKLYLRYEEDIHNMEKQFNIDLEAWKRKYL